MISKSARYTIFTSTIRLLKVTSSTVILSAESEIIFKVKQFFFKVELVIFFPFGSLNHKEKLFKEVCDET